LHLWHSSRFAQFTLEHLRPDQYSAAIANEECQSITQLQHRRKFQSFKRQRIRITPASWAITNTHRDFDSRTLGNPSRLPCVAVRPFRRQPPRRLRSHRRHRHTRHGPRRRRRHTNLDPTRTRTTSCIRRDQSRDQNRDRRCHRCRRNRSLTNQCRAMRMHHNHPMTRRRTTRTRDPSRARRPVRRQRP
jgi:hypothetical protein